jgi:hypothetical protein
MRKYLALSVVASTLLMAGGDVKPVEPAVEAVEEESVGTVSGQFRAFYVDRTISAATDNNRNSLSGGGWIGYDSAEWNGLSIGGKFYATAGVNIHDQSPSDMRDAGLNPSTDYDPSLYGPDWGSYGYLGEAYLNYKTGNTNFKIGRQKLNTPLIAADDARLLPNLFEAAVLSNTDIEDTTLILAHVTRMATGDFGNVYSPGALSLQSGYGLGYEIAGSGNFTDMGTVALGAGTDTDGVTVAAVTYKGIDNLSLQAWNYYTHDILNAFYASADYGFSVSDSVKMKASAQWINQSDVGDSFAGKVDANYVAGKLTASVGALSGYFAYSTTDADTDGNHGIITPWGGIPAYTQGMVTRHMFFNDTDTWKVAGVYKMNELLGANVKASAYYAEFDIGAENSYKAGQAWTADEWGWDVQYQATEALNLRVRANYPRDFAPGLDWDEYRIIANYNF